MKYADKYYKILIDEVKEMDILKKRWIYIVSGFIVLLFMGCGLAWSIFVVPIEEQFGWTRSQTSLAFTINILCFSVGSILTGILSKKFSFSTLLKLSAIMMGVGFFCCGFVTSIWQLYITYGVLVGVGIGIGYNAVISACPLWLPEKSATATGILLMGYALSTAIFGPVLNSLIEAVGIMSTFKTLAFVCGAGIFIGSILVRTPSLEEIQQLPQVERHAGKKTYNVITSEMIKKPIFWVYYLITVMFGGIGLVVINHSSPMMIEGLATSASFAALVVSISSISNGVARFVWGMVFDKIGVKKSLIIIAFFFVISCAGILSSLVMKNVFLFVIGACLMLISYAGNAITCPSVIRELFGHRTFSLNYSVLATDSIFTSIFPSIIGTMQQITGTYTLPMVAVSACSLINLIILFIFTRLYHKDYES